MKSQRDANGSINEGMARLSKRVKQKKASKKPAKSIGRKFGVLNKKKSQGMEAHEEIQRNSAEEICSKGRKSP